MATLGVSTNTRLLGLAIIQKDCLIDYSIHLHKQSWSPSKATRIIARLEPCESRYSINSVVLSIPHEYHQTKAGLLLTESLKKHFEAKGLAVYEKPVASLFALCPEGQKKTKKKVMETVVRRFPELYHVYKKELRNKSKYYIKLFEAVAVALLHEESK